MRKFMLITAMVLVSAAAQAGPTRSLTLASNDEPAAVQPAKDAPKAVEAPNAAEAPKFVDRPAPVSTTTEAPKAEPAKAVADKKAEKPKRHRGLSEARVIYELHRHGV